MTNFQIFSLFHQRCAESNNDGSPIDKIHSPATPKNLPSSFAFINARGTCFNMLKMNRFPPRQRKLRFSNSNCPHQWQYQRNDFHSRSGNAQGYMAAHPLPRTASKVHFTTESLEKTNKYTTMTTTFDDGENDEDGHNQ